MNNNIKSIEETYRKIVTESEQHLQKARKHIARISLLRVILFTEAVVSFFLFYDRGWSYILPLSVLPFFAFIWLVKVHNRWFYRKDYLKKKIEINRQELKALHGDFSAFDAGNEYIDPAHLYSFDLDVFGDKSLFQAANRTSTNIGSRHLADWFKHPLEEKERIVKRQEAVGELSKELEYRQNFRLFGLLNSANATKTSEIYEWANAPIRYRKHLFLRILPACIALLNACFIGAAIAGALPFTLAGIVFVGCVTFSFVFTQGITKLQITYGKKLQILSAYADQILLTERKEIRSENLRALQNELTAHGKKASQALHRLSHLLNGLDQRNNILVSTILNGLFFWELRQVMRIEQWKEENGAELPQWLEAIGEMDAYCSLATFAYNHPDYIYPDVSTLPFELEAEALGHPLMAPERCVCNDINIEKRPSFIIITGANMAGKSTYLRTVGVNYLLASIGSPVWARKMIFTPARLVTSLRTSDSLTDHESYFFAELKRLKLIIDKLRNGEKLFIILDEILKGTNSTDKQKGSFALIKQLISMNANGIIATHDLLLSTLADAFPENIRNYCFEADIANNELTFSYRMREGVAQNMNACFLMKKMGIAVIDD
ncbi:MutS family DNA mismatch repair protein [Bacteroides pyogenes]|uniref:MutS family DNA mismatch repair protein n=1 Tax=Bacteroides pyogenes TaxID=310300 RepID=UPI0011E3BDB6|nr:MutS family DNA mismatch repair protein [Bacteroides pyogenes]MBR8708938.1 DNA mismatch repair protein MutS [Bacteroides pyogenes]MBR8718838.1 DNA mismatch repair protein MutS [Bacteroides pyogenes]MBR8747197.1 DNA mismatch repair protein MutS [Bacteroides pyogenes]MBR8757541.1 DNA mismatch repair protein MutS [Bacteroides pyogenes]MBR8780808.1 DNA mismatch repair protein MutS [Bacteroides pyogenes]